MELLIKMSAEGFRSSEGTGERLLQFTEYQAK